jgi:hypothetical protein
MFRAQSAHHQDGRIVLETYRGIYFYAIYVNEQEICVSSW